MKRCSRCGEEKPSSEFSPYKRNRDGLASRCKPCSSQATMESRSRNRERHRNYQRQWRLWHFFKMSTEEFDALVAAQGGGCAICGSTENLCVDHDHDCCPTVRQNGDRACGLCTRRILCDQCNRILGFAGDDADPLRAAASYLDRFRSQFVVDRHEEFTP